MTKFLDFKIYKGFKMIHLLLLVGVGIGISIWYAKWKKDKEEKEALEKAAKDVTGIALKDEKDPDKRAALLKQRASQFAQKYAEIDNNYYLVSSPMEGEGQMLLGMDATSVKELNNMLIQDFGGLTLRKIFLEDTNIFGRYENVDNETGKKINTKLAAVSI